MLGAVGEFHGRGQIAVGLGVAEVVEEGPDDVGVGPAGVFDLARGQRHREALLDLTSPVRIAAAPAGGAHVVEGVGEDRGVLRAAGQGDGALAVGDGLDVPVGQHPQLGGVAEGEGQQPVVTGVFEDGDGLPCRVLGLLRVARPPVDAGQPAQVGAEGEGVAEGPAQGHGIALGGDGLDGVGDGVALHGVAFEQVGEFGGGVAVPLPQHEPQMGGGLAVGARLGGVLGRAGAVAGDGVLVSRPARRGGRRGPGRSPAGASGR